MGTPNKFVFINCPFDTEYHPILEAITFAVFSCGYFPRCALQIINSGERRLDKIIGLIDECDYSLHDISRTELNEHRLPRFNMPFELGLALGRRKKPRSLLVLDRAPYRYLEFISDLAGCDPCSHDNDPLKAIGKVRDWLSSQSEDPVSGAGYMVKWFGQYQRDLPRICGECRLDPEALTFSDLLYIVRYWLELNVPLA